MKYVPGPLAGQLSGSQGSTTASHNRNGAYLRNRTIPTNPRSVSQVARRSTFATITTAWRALSDAQQLAWTSLGQTIVRVDKLGQTYNLTGLQTFMSLNQPVVQHGGAIVTVAPVGAASTGPNIQVPSPNVLASGVFEVNSDIDPIPADHIFIIEATGPKSPGVHFFGHGEYRQVGIFAAAAAGPFDAIAGWEAVFGAIAGTLGAKVAIRAKLVDLTSGFATQWSDVTAIVG